MFWPEEGYTKGDLLDYYRAIAPWLLAYLRDRPLVMTRYPDGIGGKSFFQKDAPGFTPDWIRTERMWSEDTQREIDYFVCDDLASLLYVINLGASRSISGPAGCRRWSAPTGACSISIPRERRSSTWSRWRRGSSRCATGSTCR